MPANTLAKPEITTIGELSDDAIDSLATLLIDRYFLDQETKNAPAGDETKAEALKESHSYGL